MDIRAKRQSMLGQPYGASSSSLKLSGALKPGAPRQVDQPDKRIKLVCVGDGGIGKTSLLSRYISGEFPKDYVPTVFENYIRNISFNGLKVELALWDTAGQEEYDRLRSLSYPESDAIVLCYSCDSVISLENVIDRWFPEVNLYCPGTPVVLVGLKSDLASQQVSFEAGQIVADQLGAYSHIWCSAKQGSKVQDVFEDAMRAVLSPDAPAATASPAPAPKSKPKPIEASVEARRKPKESKRRKRCLIC
ncbi:GTP-binding protein RHO4 [Wickerhamiella sorbophila]|uniref:GTP-binding protein RHO4 n=1 Tax=Wickerhamiella sorbophila TaxID=45607 RepID=A0A2T0FCU0_9ASCO|nr:GTP-binding protein RHO4 [Wickerhamiella sorbophila]PRT52785.1 GTP-binding protein RHO4 [Wickerhamiella sorbophila]